jgi:hypothetical protein
MARLAVFVYDKIPASWCENKREDTKPAHAELTRRVRIETGCPLEQLQAILR